MSIPLDSFPLASQGRRLTSTDLSHSPDTTSKMFGGQDVHRLLARDVANNVRTRVRTHVRTLQDGTGGSVPSLRPGSWVTLKFDFWSLGINS